jgi:hypothetical protein
MAAGFALSNRIVSHINRKQLHTGILLMSGGAALLLLVLQFI